MKKINVCVLFGGKSAEHQVSLMSAKNVIDALDRKKYNVTLVGIDRSGKWQTHGEAEFLLNSTDPKRIALNQSTSEVVLRTGEAAQQISTLDQDIVLGKMDVVFPVLHGTNGEDGTMQGLLKLLDVPFVGAGVLGSAVSMDKDVTKRLLRDAGIPIGKFLSVQKSDPYIPSFEKLTEQLGAPFFLKPANAGSSVGVSKVKNKEDYDKALAEAFRYDRKVLIEEYIPGREIECAVLGNDDPIASIPGEIIPHHEFYSYEAKYLDENGAAAEIPANISPALVSKIQELSIKTFKTLCCEGLSRVDFFLREDNEVFVNEINTIPGFTNISMYPKLFEASGIGYSQLLDKLIELAIARFEEEKKLEI